MPLAPRSEREWGLRGQRVERLGVVEVVQAPVRAPVGRSRSMFRLLGRDGMAGMFCTGT
jgi:hypothetical protein